MAQSPSHTFGQLMGHFLEGVVEAELRPFCAERGLFLDRHGQRTGVRSGLKLTWPDAEGNTHDLDFVIERGGTSSTAGEPVAFVESAWRSYTKHSKAKAQEIQGAVLPVVDSLPGDRPFIGAVLAGQFTAPSLRQLRSVGFQVLHISRASVVKALASQGVDVNFNEETSDAEFATCVGALRSMTPSQEGEARRRLVADNRAGFDGFLEALASKLDRAVQLCSVTPLFGRAFEFRTMKELRNFLAGFKEDPHSQAIEAKGFLLLVRYPNGDRIECSFASLLALQSFLERI
jgi:hypothetical protein